MVSTAAPPADRPRWRADSEKSTSLPQFATLAVIPWWRDAHKPTAGVVVTIRAAELELFKAAEGAA